MKATAGFVGIVLAVGAAVYLYNVQLTRGTAAGAPSPQEQIDVTGIRMALLEIAQAERIYVAAHGNYGTLEQLRAEGAPALGTDRRGYTFQLDANGSQGFTATARPIEPGSPTLSPPRSTGSTRWRSGCSPQCGQACHCPRPGPPTATTVSVPRSREARHDR